MLPEELTDRRQWCCWIRSGGTKVPITPSGGTFRSNDPETFATYQEASERELLAFVISDDDPYTGIDLDNCLDEKGQLRQWAIPVVSRLLAVSYAEISPSGTGIKFITRATKPAGSRCVAKMGDDKQQLECYDHARFWTITNDVYFGAAGIGDGQAAVNWICEKFLESPSQAEPAQTGPPAGAGNLFDFEPGLLPPRESNLPLADRARMYAEAADLPSEGGRNGAAFRLAGHLLSMQTDDGFTCPAGYVLELLRAWNTRLPSPLPDREIERTVHSASKNGTAPTAKVSAAPRTDPVLAGEAVRPTGPLLPNGQKIVPPSYSTMHPPGLLSQIMEYTLRSSLYPQPELALAGAISLLATITGRKLTDQFGTRTNLYIVALAPSGAGKEQARKTNKTLLVKAGCPQYLGNERIGSHAGLLASIGHQPSRLFQIDEIGRMLATMRSPGKSPHLYQIATVLTTLYSQSDQTFMSDAYADVKKTISIDQPHAVVYGTTVPDYFWGNLTKDSVMDGLLGRIMPFEAPGSGYVPVQIPERVEPPEGVLEAIRWWHDFKPKAGDLAETAGLVHQVEHAPEAAERFVSHMSDISSRLPVDTGGAAEMWSRAAGRAGKFALIFAASRQPMTADFRVELEDVNRGIELSNHLTRQVVHQITERVVENETEDRAKRVLRSIDKPMTKSDISRKTQWLRKREREEILADLVENGTLSFSTEETGKTIRTIYFRVH